MDTYRGIELNRSARAAGATPRVFDWNEAARRIRDSNTTDAGAGLQSDWEWTGGSILTDGVPTLEEDTCTYLMSNWAAPELDLLDGSGPQECWIYQDESPGWDEHTYWPQSALNILNSIDPDPIRKELE